MEKEDELAGEGNSYTTEWRQLDTRIGRWLSTDPIFHSNMSPYNSFDNNPIYWIDPKGSNAWEPIGNGQWKAGAGDSASSLSDDAGISLAEADRIVQAQLGPNYEKNGIPMSNVEVDDVVQVRQPYIFGANPIESSKVIETEISQTMSFSVQAGDGGLFGLGWMRMTVNAGSRDQATGFYEYGGLTTTGGGFGATTGIDDINIVTVHFGSIQLNENTLKNKRTNSLAGYLNQADLTNFKNYQFGFSYTYFEGFNSRNSTRNEVGFTEYYSGDMWGWGFGLGGPGGSASADMNFEKGRPLLKVDSIYRARLNYEAGKGDTAKFGLDLRKWGESIR
jgi:RHS repeat-associated protein